jgi:U2-associated protein SR140
MSIAAAMAFVLDHADSAEEVASILCDAVLKADRDEVGVMIARMYLINDVLHNSAAPIPNAWKLRSG